MIRNTTHQKQASLCLFLLKYNKWVNQTQGGDDTEQILMRCVMIVKLAVLRADYHLSADEARGCCSDVATTRDDETETILNDRQ